MNLLSKLKQGWGTLDLERCLFVVVLYQDGSSRSSWQLNRGHSPPASPKTLPRGDREAWGGRNVDGECQKVQGTGRVGESVERRGGGECVGKSVERSVEEEQ